MSNFLTTLWTMNALENVIKNAKSFLILISSYLKFSGPISGRLSEVDKKNIPITILYGKKQEIDKKTFDFINSLKNIKLMFLENLHAKCYLNESNMILSSLNFYDYSISNNWEFSINLEKSDDDYNYWCVMDEIQTMINSSKIEIDKIRNINSIPKLSLQIYENIFNKALNTELFHFYFIKDEEGKRFKSGVIANNIYNLDVSIEFDGYSFKAIFSRNEEKIINCVNLNEYQTLIKEYRIFINPGKIHLYPSEKIKDKLNILSDDFTNNYLVNGLKQFINLIKVISKW